MKHALKLVIFAGFVAMMGSCVNTLEMAIPNNHEATNADAVATAIDYFNTHARGLLTRATDQEPTSEAPYLVGNLIPDWDSSVTVANEQKSYTDFEMQKDYRYYLVLERNADTLRGLQLYSRFVSVIDYELDTLSQYIATYIPAADYVDSYVNEYGEIDCSAWGDFSGVVLYTMLSGHHVAAYHYNDGVMEDDSFLYNYDKSQGENTTDFLTVMNGLELFVLPAEEETRASLPSHIKYIIVEVKEDNTIISHQYLLLGDNNQDDFYNNDETSNSGPIQLVEPSVIPSAGGGRQTTTQTETQIKEERKALAQSLFDTTSLTEDQIQSVGEMLEQIMQDCMGGELFNKLVTQGIVIELSFNLKEHPHHDYNDQYQFSSININSNLSDVLLHELFHAYQYAVLGASTYATASANYEIEAQIARYLYVERNYLIEREAALTVSSLGRNIKKMTQHISNKGELFDYSYQTERILSTYYIRVYNTLNNIAKTESLEPLILNSTQNSDKNLQRIVELSQNCI